MVEKDDVVVVDGNAEDVDSVETTPLPNAGRAEGMPPNVNPALGAVSDDADDEEEDCPSRSVGRGGDGGRGTPTIDIID